MWWCLVILAAVLALPISASAASGVLPYQIFWKNPSAANATLCAKMVFRPSRVEDQSDIPFCRDFRQFQVIEVRGAWAQIGTDMWIETAVLTKPALLQRFDPCVSLALNLRAIKRTASR